MNIDPATASSCFYELEGLLLDDLLNSIINVTLVFEDNAATNGGIDIYGETPNSLCSVIFSRKGIVNEYTSNLIKHHLTYQKFPPIQRECV